MNETEKDKSSLHTNHNDQVIETIEAKSLANDLADALERAQKVFHSKTVKQFLKNNEPSHSDSLSKDTQFLGPLVNKKNTIDLSAYRQKTPNLFDFIRSLFK